MPKAVCAAPITSRFSNLRVAAGEPDGVAEEHAEGGDRIEHQAEQQVVVGQHAAGLLAQAQELGAQFVLHLGAVEGVVDRQAGDDVLAVQHWRRSADVVELDGETVGGGCDFLVR